MLALNGQHLRVADVPADDEPPKPDYVIPAFVRRYGLTLLPVGDGRLIWAGECSPEMAKDMYALNLPDTKEVNDGLPSFLQRSLKPTAVRRYFSDIVAGRWEQSHQAIAFNQRGFMFDGQNRCSAIVQAGIPVKLTIFFGCDYRSMKVTDSGIIRSTVDAARISGVKISQRELAVARAMIQQDRKTPVLSQQAGIQLVSDNARVIRLVNGESARVKRREGQLVIAPVRAAAALACYHLTEDAAVRLIRVMTLQEPAVRPGDRTAMSLRDLLLNPELKGMSGACYADVWRVTERCIQCLVAGESIGEKALANLWKKPPAKNIYPIPADRI